MNKAGLKKMLEKIEAMDEKETKREQWKPVGRTQISFMLETDKLNQIKQHAKISGTSQSLMIQYALELFNERIEKVLADG